jgi:hypothetical protein
MGKGRRVRGVAEPGKTIPRFPLTDRQNQRRAELIGREIDGTITADEENELAQLQRVTLEWGEAYHEATRGDFDRALDAKLDALMARLEEQDGRPAPGAETVGPSEAS